MNPYEPPEDYHYEDNLYVIVAVLCAMLIGLAILTG